MNEEPLLSNVDHKCFLLQFPCGTSRKVSAKCETSSTADGSFSFYSVPVGQYTLVSYMHGCGERVC